MELLPTYFVNPDLRDGKFERFRARLFIVLGMSESGLRIDQLRVKYRHRNWSDSSHKVMFQYRAWVRTEDLPYNMTFGELANHLRTQPGTSL